MFGLVSVAVGKYREITNEAVGEAKADEPQPEHRRAGGKDRAPATAVDGAAHGRRQQPGQHEAAGESGDHQVAAATRYQRPWVPPEL